MSTPVDYFIKKFMLSNKRVCIFVDGENLRHSICDLFPTFKSWDYLPKQAEWANFFAWIAKEAGGQNPDLIRTYWYVVENIDVYPFNLNSLLNNKDHSRLKSILSGDDKIKGEIDTISVDKLNDFLDKKGKELLEAEHAMHNRFKGWVNIQNIIEGKNTSVEFRRAGAIRYNLFKKQLGSEKAVDVKLATDLITLKDIYDIAIVLSGDQDYVPAVDAIKDSGKRTVNVAFLKENGDLQPGGARRLSQSTDWNFYVKHADLNKFLKINQTLNQPQLL